MKSLSVICRAYDAEAPYIESFIEHYLSIGCADIHIVIPKGNPSSVLEAIINEHPKVIVYKEYPETAGDKLRGAQSIPLKHVNSTHVISVDVDEYLDIDNVMPLLKDDYIKLNWVICPYTNYESDIVYGFQDKQCKYIVKTDICEFLDDHNAGLNKKVEAVVSDTKLLHYVYRSFNDLYLKCALSNYGDYQATNTTQLCKLDDITNLPLKFKMAALYKRITNACMNITYPKYYKINQNIEDQLIKNTQYIDDIHNLKQALEAYMSRLDLEKLMFLMKKHPNYKKYGRMPHSVMGGLADLSLIDTLIPTQWYNSSKSSFKQRIKSALNI